MSRQMNTDLRQAEIDLGLDAVEHLDRFARAMALIELKDFVTAEDHGLSHQSRALAYAGLADSVIRIARTTIAICQNSDDLAPAYLMARAVAEQAATLVYLMTCSSEEYAQWEEYGAQKQFRLLDRSRHAGLLTFRLSQQHIPKPSEIPGLEEALAKYTGAKGGEKKQWSNYSLAEHLTWIEEAISEPMVTTLLLAALTMCYEIGSEIQHATPIAGAIQHLEAVGDVESHKGVVLLSVVSAVFGACLAIAGSLDAREAAGTVDRSNLPRVDEIKALIREKLDQGIRGAEGEERA